LNIKFNKSLSYAENNLNITGLPLISYGDNLVRPGQITEFVRKLTNIDGHLKFDTDEREEYERLESIILNDLQLFINYFHYVRNNNNTPKWKNFLLFLYQPCTFVKTCINDHKFINEVNKVFDIENPEQALLYIKSINLKIEEYLEHKGGNVYVDPVYERSITSLDLLIYSAYKAQLIIGVSTYNKH
jgi:hypothetical protein